MVAILVFSTTFSWGPISMVGKPWGIWFSENLKKQKRKKKFSNHRHVEQEFIINSKTQQTKTVSK